MTWYIRFVYLILHMCEDTCAKTHVLALRLVLVSAFWSCQCVSTEEGTHGPRDVQTRCELTCLRLMLSRLLHYLCDNVGVVVVQACEGLGAVTVKQRRKINSIASALSLSLPDMDAMTFDAADVWITHHSGAHALWCCLSVCVSILSVCR